MDFQVTHPESGETFTVSDDAVALPDGHAVVKESDYISRATLKNTHVTKQAFDSRFNNWISREEAHKDADIAAAVLQDHGRKADFDSAKITRLEEKAADMEGKYSALMGRVARADMLSEAAKVFDEKWVKSPSEGIPSYAEAALGKLFRYDEASKQTIAIDAAGDPIPSARGTAENPYMGVSERFEQIAGDPAWAQYLKEPPKNNSGSGFARNGKAGSAVAKKRSEMSTAEKAAYVSEHGQDAYLALPS